MELINEIKGTMADVPLVLVGNKNDEEAGPREVSYATGETLQVTGLGKTREDISTGPERTLNLLTFTFHLITFYKKISCSCIC